MTLAFAPERIEHWPLARLQPYAPNAVLLGPNLVAARIAARSASRPVLFVDNREEIADNLGSLCCGLPSRC
jgi:hypothetical protein